MPQIVKIKRRNASDDNAPGSLAVGELAYNEYQQVLRIGKDNGGAGQHIIAGQGSFVPWPGSTGLVVHNTARSGATPPTAINRSIAGTTNEIDVSNGDGVSGNPTIGIADNAILPGTGGIIPTSGTTAQRPGGPTEGTFRYNSDDNVIEWFNGSGWAQAGTSSADSFSTWTPDSGGNLVADSSADTVTVTGLHGLQTIGTPGTDTLSIDTSAAVTFESTDAGATAGPDLILDRDSATAAAADELGRVLFRGETAAAAGNHDYAAIMAVIEDATAATEDGKIVFQTSSAGGALASRIQVEADGTLSSLNATYEALVTADDDIPNKKYVDDAITTNAPAQNLFETIAGDTGTAVADTTTDTITMTGGEGIVTTAATTPDTVTFDLDIPNLTSLGAAPATGDQFVIYDITGTEHKEMTVGELFTSPAFTGDPVAPTPAQTDNDTSIATTAFVRAVRLDQFAAPTASVAFNSQQITGVADATSADHAVNFGQLSAVASGVDWKESVDVATTQDLGSEGTGHAYNATAGSSGRGQHTWSAGPTTIDGVTLANGDRILVKDNSPGDENGIFVRTDADTWDRSTDADEDAEVTGGLSVWVNEGSLGQIDTGWVLTTNDPITVGGGSGTALVFTQNSGLGQIVAGAALTKSGNTLDVAVDDSTIEVNTDQLRVKASGTVGNVLVTTGGGAVWGSVDLADADATTGSLGPTAGGTGIATYTTGDILYASATNVLSKRPIGSTDNFLTITGGVPVWTDTVDGGTF